MPAIKPTPTKICEACGKEFERTRYNGRMEDSGRFAARRNCSQACANTRRVAQANTHRWRARKIAQPKECRDCGATTKLHVHHDDRDVTNNDPANLIVLCASCHLRLHWREDRAARMASILAGTRQPSSDGSRYLEGPPLHPLRSVHEAATV